MVQTSARLLALLSLLQVRREWTGQELADRLEVTPRTIRRDVDKLRSLGYPGGGRAGRGRRLSPQRRRRAPAAAARRRRGGRRRRRAAHRRLRLDRGNRGDLGARAGQARAGPAITAAPPGERAERRHVGVRDRRPADRRRRAGVPGGRLPRRHPSAVPLRRAR